MGSNAPFGGYPGAANVSNRVATYFDINLSIARLNGEDLNIKGDWFVIEGGSIGAVRASFAIKEGRETQSILLAPGRVFHMPFSNVRIFNDAVALENSVIGVVPMIARVIFGIGTPVFDDRSIHDGSRFLLQGSSGASAQTRTPTIAQDFYAVTEGMVVDIYIDASQVTAAAETSVLRPTVTLQGQPIAPDNLVNNDVTVAGVGVARALDVFRNIIIPRGCSILRVSLSNTGTAATNSIAMTSTVLAH